MFCTFLYPFILGISTLFFVDSFLLGLTGFTNLSVVSEISSMNFVFTSVLYIFLFLKV